MALGAAAVRQAWVGAEASWYPLWALAALAVAGGCWAAARGDRGVLLAVLPLALAAGLDDGWGGSADLWLLPLILAGFLLIARAERRYRL